MQLKLVTKRSEKILATGKRETIKRHVETLQSVNSATNERKRIVEEQKIARKTSMDDISDWNDKLELVFGATDLQIARLNEWLVNEERSSKAAAQEEQFKAELKLHEQKLRMESEISSPKSETQECLSRNAKLPKLVITKFNGSFKDWPRFWGQFTEGIDKSSVAAITKFTYLLELLTPKAKTCVESLPFSVEGYNRAKAILKDKYGKESEIVKSYVKEILELPSISNSNPRRISEFSETLTYCVRALQTLNKLDQVNGNVSMTLDKLSCIRGDLVRTDPEWEAWDFDKLAEALRQWVKRNPVTESEPRKDDYRKKLFHANRGEQKLLGCIYCGDVNHKAVSCTKVVTQSERKQILAKKGLCFNCATKFHRASECASKTSCKHCNKRHHSSICEQYKHERDDAKNENEQQASGAKKVMTDGVSAEGIFPVVIVKVNGVMTRALIDSGAGSSYASGKLINALNIKPSEIKTQRIDMLMTSQTKRIEVFDVEISSLDDSCKINVKMNKVEKSELLTTRNPNYDRLVRQYKHLNSVKMDECDTKSELPVHVVLGNGEYARIKTRNKPLVGSDGEPVAELTKFGWMIMSPGVEWDQNMMLMTTTSQSDFERLCRLDVLGLEDTSEKDPNAVYDDFKDDLTRDKEGWYETSLPWKPHHPDLPTNERGSERRLVNLVKRLERKGIYNEYDQIIQGQLEKGIVEPAPGVAKGKEFYIPHKPVVKQSAETTKLRVVYDASAKESSTDPSLNECLNPGPSLQNHLWDILVRARFLPIVLTADLEKAFLQVRIRKAQRDSLRFHWKPPGSDDVIVYRFTRALFGLTCSPFLLGGVLNEHLTGWEKEYPALVKEIKDGLYVDDVMLGGDDVDDVKRKKANTVEVFDDATFSLHKWHSNVTELEGAAQTADDSDVGNLETTFAKQQLGTGNETGTKILGMGWNKSEDTLSVIVNNEESAATTKRKALSQVASIYDPLGIVSPTTLVAKLLYREMCDEQLAWDEEFNSSMKRRWLKWYERLPCQFTIPRTLAPYRDPLQSITLHGFGDASKNGVAAVVYAVAKQESGTTRGIVCSKSRLAKKNLTIPRLELVAGHMTANLVTNVERAIGSERVSNIHCWLDSTVALHWINGKGEYRLFVANRVKKIKELDRIKWHHVPTNENPADLGSRGGDVVENELWHHGPAWLTDQAKWPPEVVPEASAESKAEEKPSSRVLVTMNTTPENVFDQILEKYSLRKTLRICA